jgi:hypothetical protein
MQWKSKDGYINRQYIINCTVPPQITNGPVMSAKYDFSFGNPLTSKIRKKVKQHDLILYSLKEPGYALYSKEVLSTSF